MADTSHRHGKRVTRITEVTHPLDPLTEGEISQGRSIIEAAGLITDTVRFPAVLPVEPDKKATFAWKPGKPFDRSILYVLLDTATGISHEVVVSVTDEKIVSQTKVKSDEHPYGQPPYLFEEYERVEALVKAHPEWQAAIARRGITNVDDIFCAPLAPGYFGHEDEIGRRMIRSLTFLRDTPDDSPWAHPVEGLLVTIDLTKGEVVRVQDEGDVPTPTVSGNYDVGTVGPARESLRPLEITQPEGPSFTVNGSLVEWENWKFRVSFNSREGLVLNQVTFTDKGEDRSVLYRASVPEMVVPYGDTSINRYWISYFDAGEYLLGKNANPLVLGCDCLGVIHYFDGVAADDHGHPMVVGQAVCMHEEDYGVLWKHTDLAGNPDSRRSRRFVISYFATIGNYDYGFFWYLYLDGTIQVEAKATGVVFNGAGVPGSHDPHAHEIAPGLFAPVHQHLFSARLDVAVDGLDNSVHEVEVVGVPTGPENPHGNAFTYTVNTLQTEGGRLANNPALRTWHVTSGHRTNYTGASTQYQLIPQGYPVLMAQPESSVAKRAAFATQHLWVTKYEPNEMWPAGMYPNQHAGGAGLPEYVAGGDSIVNEDIVLWHQFGPTHIPRTEDWPVMPVDYSGFLFKPFGFFDVNPALNLPDGANSSCTCCGSGRCGTDACTCNHEH
jgi:primary-amine oxidase